MRRAAFHGLTEQTLPHVEHTLRETILWISTETQVLRSCAVKDFFWDGEPMGGDTENIGIFAIGAIDRPGNHDAL